MKLVFMLDTHELQAVLDRPENRREVLKKSQSLLTLKSLGSQGTLSSLETSIRLFEELGYELISLSSCRTQQRTINVACYRKLQKPQNSGTVRLIEIQLHPSPDRLGELLLHHTQGDTKVVSLGSIHLNGAHKNILAVRPRSKQS